VPVEVTGLEVLVQASEGTLVDRHPPEVSDGRFRRSVPAVTSSLATETMRR
jgi:hypothetical protein